MRSITVEWDEKSVVVILPGGAEIHFTEDTSPDDIDEEIRKYWNWNPPKPAEPAPPTQEQDAFASSMIATIGRLCSIGEYVDDENLRAPRLNIAEGGRIHPDVLRRSAYWRPFEVESRWRSLDEGGSEKPLDWAGWYRDRGYLA
jgi:hypothetical protein